MGGKKLALPEASGSDKSKMSGQVRLPAVESPMRDARFLRAIIDNHPSPVFVINAKTRELEMANAAAGEFQEGSSCNAILYGTSIGSPPSNRCFLPAVMASREPVKGVHRICGADGQINSCQLHCVPVFDAGGEVSHVIHYFSELPNNCQMAGHESSSEELEGQTLADLREEKERAQLYLDIATVVLVSLDAHGRISLLNRKGGELLGCEPREALGMDWFGTFIPEQVRDAVRTAFFRIISGELSQLETFENPIVSLDGTQKLMLWRNALLRDQDGNIIGTLSSGEDITQRRAAELALMESERRFRELADQLPQTAFEANLDGRLTFANANAFKTYGYTADDFEDGISVFDLLDPKDVGRAREMIASIVQKGGSTPGYEYLARKKDGTTMPVAIYASPIVRKGEVVGVRGIVTDISERKRFEEEAIKREKMESVSRLAGGIAHDFNNMLSPILAGTTLSISILQGHPFLSPADRAEVLKLLHEAESASIKASRLTGKMMNLSKGIPLVRQTASLAELVHETAELILIGSNIELDFSAPEAPLPSSVDRTQLDQVISNIVTNAKYAMPNGGRISISLCEHPVYQGNKFRLRPGRYVRISISDEGTGIPADVLPKIFEPYFTTKGSKGTGLGLATSFNIVKGHDGHLDVETTVGKGTTFHIYLPISSEEINPDTRNSMSIIPGHGRVLVMDDEDYVRSIAQRVLGTLGYSCECASNGEEAISMYNEALGTEFPYAVVILDLTVKSGLGGMDTLALLKEIDPGVKAIASSGYSEGFHDLLSAGFSAILPKPYSVSALSKIVHELTK